MGRLCILSGVLRVLVRAILAGVLSDEGLFLFSEGLFIVGAVFWGFMHDFGAQLQRAKVG